LQNDVDPLRDLTGREDRDLARAAGAVQRADGFDEALPDRHRWNRVVADGVSRDDLQSTRNQGSGNRNCRSAHELRHPARYAAGAGQENKDERRVLRIVRGRDRQERLALEAGGSVDRADTVSAGHDPIESERAGCIAPGGGEQPSRRR
jgi:hypothetical protein